MGSYNSPYYVFTLGNNNLTMKLPKHGRRDHIHSPWDMRKIRNAKSIKRTRHIKMKNMNFIWKTLDSSTICNEGALFLL